MPNFEHIAKMTSVFMQNWLLSILKLNLSPYFGKTDVAIDSTIVKFQALFFFEFMLLRQKSTKNVVFFAFFKFFLLRLVGKLT
jgi:hypothetical protein